MSEVNIVITEVFSVEEASDFRENVRNHMDNGVNQFLLDFRDCRFIDSTGLGVIVGLYKRSAEIGGGIKLKSLNPNVRKVFDLTRLTNIFEIV